MCHCFHSLCSTIEVSLKNKIPHPLSTFGPVGPLSSNGMRMCVSCGVSVVVCVYRGIVQNELKCGYNASVVHASSFHPDIYACTHVYIYILKTANRWG